MQLPTKKHLHKTQQRTLIITTLFISGIFIIYFSLLRTPIKQLKRAKQQHTSLIRQQQKLTKQSQQDRAMQQTMQQLKAQFQPMIKSTALLTQLMALLKNCSLRVINIKPLPNLQQQGVSLMPFQLQLSGNSAGFYQFIQQLPKQDFLGWLSAFKLTRTQLTQPLYLQLRVEIYRDL